MLADIVLTFGYKLGEVLYRKPYDFVFSAKMCKHWRESLADILCKDLSTLQKFLLYHLCTEIRKNRRDYMYLCQWSRKRKKKEFNFLLFSFTLFFIYLQSAYAVYLLCPHTIVFAFPPAVIVNPFYGVPPDEPFVLLEVILCLLLVHELCTIVIVVLVPHRY